MKKIIQTFEDLFADIAFAEERACKSSEVTMKNIIERFENNFVAIAFAEAGELKTIKSQRKKRKKPTSKRFFKQKSFHRFA